MCIAQCILYLPGAGGSGGVVSMAPPMRLSCGFETKLIPRQIAAIREEAEKVARRRFFSSSQFLAIKSAKIGDVEKECG